MLHPFDPVPSRDLYHKTLLPVLSKFPPAPYLDERNEFYLQLLNNHGLLQSGKSLVDLGAGLSIFGPICRGHGMKVALVDDFGGGGGVELGRQREAIPLLDAFEKEFGLDIVCENFLERPLPLPDGQTDVVTCFHSLEHWHHSPKRLFQEITRILKPGGFLILATPNAANIRKRIYVPLGRNIFPPLREWYHDGDPVFRGHVREPIVRDLQQLMEWNGLAVRGTYGRNFIGRQSQALAFLPAQLVNCLASGSDRLLRFFPGLCSDIHVIGQKPL